MPCNEVLLLSTTPPQIGWHFDKETGLWLYEAFVEKYTQHMNELSKPTPYESWSSWATWDNELVRGWWFATQCLQLIWYQNLSWLAKPKSCGGLRWDASLNNLVRTCALVGAWLRMFACIRACVVREWVILSSSNLTLQTIYYYWHICVTNNAVTSNAVTSNAGTYSEEYVYTLS